MKTIYEHKWHRYHFEVNQTGKEYSLHINKKLMITTKSSEYIKHYINGYKQARKDMFGFNMRHDNGKT